MSDSTNMRSASSLFLPCNTLPCAIYRRSPLIVPSPAGQRRLLVLLMAALLMVSVGCAKSNTETSGPAANNNPADGESVSNGSATLSWVGPNAAKVSQDFASLCCHRAG